MIGQHIHLNSILFGFNGSLKIWPQIAATTVKFIESKALLNYMHAEDITVVANVDSIFFFFFALVSCTLAPKFIKLSNSSRLLRRQVTFYLR